MTPTGLLVSTLTLWALVAPANDEPEVSPAPWSSRVHIEARATSPSHESRARASKSTGLTQRCDQGPGARAANLPCGVMNFPGTYSPMPKTSPGAIERAVREIPMPALTTHIQPDGETLVNVETIFYTDPTTLRRTVTLLGHSVQVVARPVSYAWHHGDGTTDRTSRPGRPYPAKDVTHRYRDTGENLRTSVDTGYRVTYSVDGGTWQTLSGTLTAPGPTTTLDVAEAAPVLTR